VRGAFSPSFLSTFLLHSSRKLSTLTLNPES
jgi:hypothetical protein